jgi:hypothetical protein
MSRSQAGRQHRLKPRLQILTSREVKPDGSALLALVPANASLYEGPLWLIPLPAGEPRHLGSLETKNADIFPDGRIGECPTVRYLVDSLENGAFLPPRETDSTHEWTAALYAATTEPRWKADFCSRYEATWRTGCYDMQSHQFHSRAEFPRDVTFSRDGKWVAYASYPDHTLWRSRSDGSERMQLTYPPMSVGVPSISPDGTKVAFHTCCDKFEVFVRHGRRDAAEG